MKLRAQLARLWNTRNTTVSLLAMAAGLLTVTESVYWMTTSPWTWARGATFTIRLIAIAWFILDPGIGGIAVACAQVMDFLSPWSTPISMLFMGLLATGITGFMRRRVGAGVALILVAGAAGNLVSRDTSFMNDGGIVSYASLVLATTVVGTATRTATWRHDQEKRNREMRRNTAITQRLHDYAMNDMNDVIMLLDEAISRHADIPERRALKRIRTGAVNALTQTRKAIVALEYVDTPEDAGAPTVRRQPGTPGRSTLHQQVCALLDEQQDILQSLGFQGTVLLPNTLPPSGEDNTDLIVGLVRELLGNVAHHADPSQGYTLALCADVEALDVSLADTPVDPPSPGVSPTGLGSGLRRYAAAITARRGEWEVHAQPRSWSLHASIPWSPTVPDVTPCSLP